MLLLIKLAFRNLREHWVKTLILGVIIFNSVFVLVVGEAFLGTAQQGIKESFINDFTGDVIIKGQATYPFSLFGVQAPGGIEENPSIPDYASVRDYLLSERIDEIESITMLISGFSIIRIDGQKHPDARGFAFLFGVDGDSYFSSFPDRVMVEGRVLKSGEPGIILSEANRKKMVENLGCEIKLGDTIKLIGMSNAGPKIREVPIVGFFEFSDSGDDLNFMSFVDIQTLRALKGLNLSAAENIVIEDDKVELLSAIDANDSIDDLFADDLFAFETVEDSGFDEKELIAQLEKTPTKQSKEKLEQKDNYKLTGFEEEIIQELTSCNLTSSLKDKGPREFILIKLKKGHTPFIFNLRANKWFQENGISVVAGNWKKAAGPFAGMADLVVILYYIAIILVVVIAFFIVINTLVISVIQRKKEVGTMRALGAKKSYIAKMFTIEIILISLLFSFLGIITAVTTLFIVGLFEFEAANTLFRVIFNGAVLKPTTTPIQLLNTVIIVLVIGILANIYPLFVAMKVQPVEAMRE